MKSSSVRTIPWNTGGKCKIDGCETDQTWSFLRRPSRGITTEIDLFVGLGAVDVGYHHLLSDINLISHSEFTRPSCGPIGRESMESRDAVCNNF
jgi:hypothetical protein